MNINFNSSLFGGIKRQEEDPSSKLTALGVPANIIAQGDSAIQKYAQEHGINLPAKQQPQQQEKPMFGGMNQGGVKEDIETKLKALGIPSNIITQGKSAIESYAAQNNITLPTPPAQGSKLNVMA